MIRGTIQRLSKRGGVKLKLDFSKLKKYPDNAPRAINNKRGCVEMLAFYGRGNMYGALSAPRGLYGDNATALITKTVDCLKRAAKRNMQKISRRINAARSC